MPRMDVIKKISVTTGFQERLIFLVCLALLLPTFLKATEPLKLSDRMELLKIGSHLELLEDNEKTITIQSIAAGAYDNDFVPMNNEKINLGFSRSTWWIRIETENLEKDPIAWVLFFWGDADSITFFRPVKNQFEEEQTGNAFPNISWPMRTISFAFPITSPPGRQTYYLKLENADTISIYPHAAGTLVFKDAEIEFLSIGLLMVGILLALAFYNMILYVTVREFSYLYLGLFIVSYTLMLFSIIGFVKYYFDFRSHALNNLLSLSSFLFLILFTRSFLNTEKNFPRLDRIAEFSVVALVPFLFLPFFLSRYISSQLSILLSICVLVLALLFGLLSLLEGVKEARCYMLASSLFLVGLILLMVDYFGIFPHIVYAEHISSAGFVLMVFILSMGVSNKIGTIKSERIAALEAMQQSEQQLNSIFQNATEGIYRFTPGMRFLKVNPAMAEMFGYDSTEELEKISDFQKHLDPETPGKIRKLLKGKSIVKDFLSRAYRKDGRMLYVSISTQEVKDETGKPLYYEGFMVDITEIKHTENLLRLAKEELEERVRERTRELYEMNKNLTVEIDERKKIEVALKESEERYRLLIETMNEGFAIVDRDNMLTYANRRLKEMFLFGEDEEATGHRITEFLDEKNLGILNQQIEARKTGKKTPYEITWLKRDGSPLPTIVSPQPVFDENGNFMGSASVLTDVTALKTVEAELKKARDAAENANMAKSEFLANMSHEIRTPMNAVLGFTELMTPLVKGEKAQNYLEAIKAGGKSLLMLINDILDLSKIEAGKMELNIEAINPHTVFNEVKQVFALKVEQKGLEFIIDIATDIPSSLLLDEIRLRQILFNLVGNAVKFTGKGHIKITAGKIYTREDKSTLDLVISVEDTGIGIARESQAKIFEAFRQQDGHDTKQYGGTGLGLAITKRLVEMLDGQIDLESEINKGSRFEIVLHDVAVAATTVAEEKKEAGFHYESIDFEHALILVVDDIEANRVLVREFLTKKHFSVIDAENGRIALDLARKHHPNLVLMDIKMPVMDGYKAVKQMKTDDMLKDIPVVALTASALRRDRNKILNSGFDGFLHKPVLASELFRELTQFLTYSQKEDRSAHQLNIETVIDGAMVGTADGELEISKETAARLPAIITHLETEGMVHWEKARKNGYFNEINDFGYYLKQLGEDNKLILLEEFGKTIMSNADNFDIENMTGAMNTYPKLIKQLKVLSLKASLKNN